MNNRVNAVKHDDFIAACARAGFTPHVTMEASESQAALGLVAAGLGMTLIQQSVRYQDGVAACGGDRPARAGVLLPLSS